MGCATVSRPGVPSRSAVVIGLRIPASTVTKLADAGRSGSADDASAGDCTDEHRHGQRNMQVAATRQYTHWIADVAVTEGGASEKAQRTAHYAALSTRKFEAARTHEGRMNPAAKWLQYRTSRR
jgi:hypothetical protein